MSEARRLLVVTYHFGADGPVGGLRWLGLTKYLSRRGWSTAVVTAGSPAVGDAIGTLVERCPRFPTAIDALRLLRRLASPRAQGWHSNGSGVGHQPQRASLLRRLGREVEACLVLPDDSRGWMLRAALRTRSVIGRFRPDVIVSSGPPHAAHLVAWMATRGLRRRWFVDVRDPWAGPLPKIWQSDRTMGSRTFRALAPRLERLVFGAADGVITNTQPLAEVLRTRYPDVPFVHVPNGVDLESLPRPAENPYPGLSIAYAGMLYAGRDVGPVVRALRLFFERHPEAAHAGSKLRIAGAAEREHARAFATVVADAGLEPYVEMLGSLPRTEALTLVSRSRLAVVLAQQQELQIPAKLYESVAMGVPTLVVAPADTATAVEGQRVGAAVHASDDVAGIAGLLEQLWRDGRRKAPPSAAITYDAIADQVDELLRRPRSHGAHAVR